MSCEKNKEDIFEELHFGSKDVSDKTIILHSLSLKDQQKILKKIKNQFIINSYIEFF